MDAQLEGRFERYESLKDDVHIARSTRQRIYTVLYISLLFLLHSLHTTCRYAFVFVCLDGCVDRECFEQSGSSSANCYSRTECAGGEDSKETA